MTKSFYRVFKITFTNNESRLYDNVRDLYDYLIDTYNYTSGFSYLERVIYKQNIRGWFVNHFKTIEFINPQELELINMKLQDFLKDRNANHSVYVARITNKFIKATTAKYIQEYNKGCSIAINAMDCS